MAILERHDQGAVARLVLNRPKALNALSVDLLTALGDAFAALAEDRSVRVVVLAGAGRAFCAGHDLREMTEARAAPDGGAAAFTALFERCGAVCQAISALPQPVIAEVQGLATAAGCQLVASCDLALASEEARFGVNGVNIGLFCSTPMVALSRNIGRKATFEMLTTGGFISAARAAELGLINRAVAPGALEAEIRALAETIAGKLGLAVRIGKRAFYEQLEMPLAAAYDYAGAVMVANMMADDTAEGISAFLDKRAPNWTQDAS
ncbi:MAG: enoyl-CoA hydratase [Rhodobacteraceae bacterium]|nr:enoyl-CoA hydratase [Paracoccaceae bacterium]